MRHALIASALFAFAAARPAAAGAPAFGSPVVYPAAPGSSSVSASDFNGDGLPDLAIAGSYGGAISVFLGTGGGAFGPTATFPVSGQPWVMAPADFNRDGRMDLAVVTVQLDGLPPGIDIMTRLDILLGDGTGSFATATRTDLGDLGIQSIAVGDFNGDKLLDVAAAGDGTFGGRASILLMAGDGAGGLMPPTTLPLADFPGTMSAGDVNRDGRLDLLVGMTHEEFPVPGEPPVVTGSLLVLLGDGAGGFAPLPPMPLGASFAFHSVLADFDGDGVLDLATLSRPWSALEHVLVLIGTGDGHFQLSADTPMTTGAQGLAAADVNSDGLVDLVMTGTPPDLTVLAQQAGGGFGPPARFPVLFSASGYALAVSDFDRDGRPDVALTVQWDSHPDIGVAVLLNQSGNAADISIDLSHSPEPANAGRDLTLTVHVRNNGPDVAGVLVTVNAPGLTVTAVTTTAGWCAPPSSEPAGCDVGNLTGGGPGGAATIVLHVVSPPLGGTFTITTTAATRVVDADPTNNVATQTVELRAIGGRDVSMAAAPGGGVALAWRGGTAQAGYLIGRWVDGVTTILPEGPTLLPAGATSFVDASPVAGKGNCYIVAPVDAAANALGWSEMLCHLPGSGTGDRLNTVLRTDQSAPFPFSGRTVTTLTFEMPAGTTHPVVWRLDVETGRVDIQGARNGEPSYLPERPTCWAIAAYQTFTLLGRSDVMCQVPGFSTLPP